MLSQESRVIKKICENSETQTSRRQNTVKKRTIEKNINF